ncbi:MAG: ABC transporter, partial [Firmicutes bacterium]|nr:ABC transporter [Bacillota bacterium]
VLLARALCATKKMLLVDEPVAGLDPEAQYEMYGILHHLNHNRGVTIVMVSHDLEAVDKYADHVLSMGQEITYR